MNRRHAIRQILTVSAGVVLIPSCLGDRTKASFLLKNYQLTAGQEELLAELAEAIIPKTDTPGAKDIYAHQFVMKMMDDCASPEEQQQFVRGLDAFAEYARKKAGVDFKKASAAQRAGVLEEFEKNKEGKADEVVFYKAVKGLTLRAYTSSQFFLTKVQVYELVPGRWSGCVPVKNQA
jgi:hypothetical protein